MKYLLTAIFLTLSIQAKAKYRPLGTCTLQASLLLMDEYVIRKFEENGYAVKKYNPAAGYKLDKDALYIDAGAGFDGRYCIYDVEIKNYDNKIKIRATGVALRWNCKRAMRRAVREAMNGYNLGGCEE